MSKKLTYIALVLTLAFSLGGAHKAEAARTQSFLGTGYFTTVGDAFNTIYYNSGPLDIGSSLSAFATLFVQGYAGSATSTFATASSTGIKTFDVSSTGTTTVRQIVGFAKPTVATSTGAGSVMGTSTLDTYSTDVAGSIYLTTGSTPAVNATIFTVTSASSSVPFCILEPMTSLTSESTGSTTYMATTSTGFSLKSGPVALLSTTTYQWNYLCN